MKLTIVLEPQEEGGFTVYVPSLPGCISEGNTKKEAIKKNAKLWTQKIGRELQYATSEVAA